MSARFAQPFRDQVDSWLRRTGTSGAPVRVFSTGYERIVIARNLDCPDGFATRDVLVVEGDLSTGSHCHLAGPVWVGGRCEIGKGSQALAVAAGRALVLGHSAEVTDWADCDGPIEMRPASRVNGPAASSQSIRLACGASASQFVSPAVITEDYIPELEPPAERGEYVEVLPPARGLMPDFTAARSFQPQKLSPLAAETWVYEGSLHLRQPLLLRAKLVVRGSFTCGRGSLLDDDVKAGGDIGLEPGSIASGHLTSAGDMTLGDGCLFSGDLNAGMNLRLGAGVRGFRHGGPVLVKAHGKLTLASNVLVRGELHSRQQVTHLRPERASGLDLLLAHG